MSLDTTATRSSDKRISIDLLKDETVFAAHFPFDFISQGAHIHLFGFDLVNILLHNGVDFFIDSVFFTHILEDGVINGAGHQIIVGDEVDLGVIQDHFQDPVTQVFNFILAQPHGRLQGWGLNPIESLFKDVGKKKGF